MTRAVVATGYGGPEVLEVVDVDVPDPGPGEVVVAVRAAGVNPADAKAYSGMWGTDPAALPKRLGFEVSGVVTAVGPDATGSDGAVSVGDEVIAFRVQGGYADALVVPAKDVVRKPSTLGWEQAAGLLLAGTAAAHAVAAAGVGEGDVVLLHGAAGAVGSVALQLAVAEGARVIGTASPDNHDLVRSLGGEPVAYGEGLADRVRALAPDGVDAAIDTVGSDEAVDTSFELTHDRDRVVSLAAFRRADSGIKLLGAGGDTGDELRDAARPELARLAGEGKLRVDVAATYALDDVASAHRDLMQPHPPGKFVLLP